MDGFDMMCMYMLLTPIMMFRNQNRKRRRQNEKKKILTKYAFIFAVFCYGICLVITLYGNVMRTLIYYLWITSGYLVSLCALWCVAWIVSDGATGKISHRTKTYCNFCLFNSFFIFFVTIITLSLSIPRFVHFQNNIGWNKAQRLKKTILLLQFFF